MVETGLKQWLKRGESPSDFYELVGQPRLSRDRDQLLSSLEAASEYLFQFQNHKDRKIRERARTFQRLVADARRTIADESRWAQYDEKLITKLHGLSLKNPDFSGANPKLDNLRRWLAMVQDVDPARVEELIEAWTSDRPQQKPVKPASGGETQSHAAESTKSLPRSEPRKPQGASTEDDDLEVYDLSEPASSDREMPVHKPGISPPPPPGRSSGSNSRSRDLKSPPPPPPKAGSSQQITPVAQYISPVAEPPAPSVMDRFPGNSGSNATALWIVLAALLAAVVLAMFGLIIAWASGAFDRGRAGVDSRAGAVVVQIGNTSKQTSSRQPGLPGRVRNSPTEDPA